VPAPALQAVHVVASLQVSQLLVDAEQSKHVVPSDHWLSAQATHTPPDTPEPAVPAPDVQVVHVVASLHSVQPAMEAEQSEHR